MSATCHREMLAGGDARLVQLVDLWDRRLDFDRCLIQVGRTSAEAVANYAKGRARQPDGSWIVVDRSKVVTNAPDGSKTPHCRTPAQALDCMPLILGHVVWDEKSPLWPRTLAALREMAHLATACGFRWGGDFQHLKDLDHFETSDWQKFPLAG